MTPPDPHATSPGARTADPPDPPGTGTRPSGAEADASGAVLLGNGRQALIARLALARHALRTLDLQYYLWHDDATGQLLAREVLDAADRGVRVRILLDDVHLAGRDQSFAALDRHRHIEIRYFNPFRVRAWPSLRRLFEVIRDGGRLNHRMHNKAFVADGRSAIVGGRNIGDEYFAAGEEANFRDMDLLVQGPVVTDIATSFEHFWNSPFVIPVRRIVSVRLTRRLVRHWFRKLRRFRLPQASLAAYAELSAADLGNELQQIVLRMHWGRARAVYDLPDKASGAASPRLLDAMAVLAGSAGRELLIETAYFIPDERALAALAGLRQRGVAITILTNSLASNDVIAAHAGYARGRRSVLDLGVRLFEVRSREARRADTVGGGQVGSRASLHTKAVVIDRAIVVIGTLNLDPRSLYTNTEIALIVDSAGLAAEVGDAIDAAMAGGLSYEVLPAGKPGSRAVTWRDPARPALTWTTEPESSMGRRLLAAILRRLPIHHLL